MTKFAPGINRWLGYLRKALFILLPIVILVFIFNRIDLAEFKVNLARTNPWLVLLGIAFRPLLILIGANRWRLVVQRFLGRSLPAGFMMRHYWIGLALGMFAPSSIGWDIYRVVVVGRRFGGFSKNMAAIFAEKLIALVNIILMIALIFPLVNDLIVNDRNLAKDLIRAAYLVMSIILVAGGSLALAKRHAAGSAIRQRAEQFIAVKMTRVNKVLDRSVEIEPGTLSYANLVKPATRPGTFIPVLMLSLAIQCSVAVGSQIMFRAVGYDLPLVINLFLAPVFFFVFMLPISFGSLGIREGAYIILYGLFGVPAEIALLISFFNLAGILLNNMIGGLIIWIKGRDYPGQEA